MIEIQLVKQLLILTPGELTSLLAPKPKLWQKALKRGNAAKTRVLYGTTNGEGGLENMTNITIEFKELDELSNTEIKVALVRFTEARDQYAKDGRKGMAALFHGVAEVLDEERHRRQAMSKWLMAQIYGDDDDDEEWNDDK